MRKATINIKRAVWDWTYMRWAMFDDQTYTKNLAKHENLNDAAAALLDPILKDTFKPLSITTNDLYFSDLTDEYRQAHKEAEQTKIVVTIRTWEEA